MPLILALLLAAGSAALADSPATQRALNATPETRTAGESYLREVSQAEADCRAAIDAAQAKYQQRTQAARQAYVTALKKELLTEARAHRFDIALQIRTAIEELEDENAQSVVASTTQPAPPAQLVSAATDTDSGAPPKWLDGEPSGARTPVDARQDSAPAAPRPPGLSRFASHTGPPVSGNLFDDKPAAAPDDQPVEIWLKVVSALYGAPGHAVDVTPRVAALLEDAQTICAAADILGADPAPREGRSLAIRLDIQGHLLTLIVPQGHTFNLEVADADETSPAARGRHPVIIRCGGTSSFQLLGARYGDGSNQRDVRRPVVTALETGQPVNARSWQLGITDPDPGMVKYLAVDLQFADHLVTLELQQTGQLLIDPPPGLQPESGVLRTTHAHRP